MTRAIICASFIFFTGLSLIGSAATAADRETEKPTVIHVDEMCGGCVKKVHRRFGDDDKVGRIECDADASTVTFHPARGKSYTARYLWVEMDEIGKAPLKLVGPEGTFTSKPRKN